jgi:hypothetical protein
MKNKFTKQKVLTIPEYEGRSNVISRVYWEMVFSDEGYESVAAGVTDFELNNLEDFKVIEEVTDEDLQQWVIEASFGSNWAEFVAQHQSQIDFQKVEKDLTEHYVSPDFVSPFSNNS